MYIGNKDRITIKKKESDTGLTQKEPVSLRVTFVIRFDLETGSILLLIHRSLAKLGTSRTTEDGTKFVLMLDVTAGLG